MTRRITRNHRRHLSPVTHSSLYRSLRRPSSLLLALFSLALLVLPSPFSPLPSLFASGPRATNDPDHLWPRFLPLTSGFYGSSIAVDRENVAHAAWSGGTNIGYGNNRWQGRGSDGWSSSTTIATTTRRIVGSPSIAVAPDGKRYVAWAELFESPDNPPDGNTDIFYSMFDPAIGTWASPTRLTTGEYSFDTQQLLVIRNLSYSTPRIISDRAGNIHVLVYKRDYSETDPRDLREILYCQNFTALELIAGASGSALGNDYPTNFYRVAADPAGSPHVAWIRSYSVETNALYNRRTGGAWQTPAILGTGIEDVVGTLDLTVDESDIVHVALTDSLGVAYQSVNNGTPNAPIAIAQQYTIGRSVHISMRGDEPQMVWTGRNAGAQRAAAYAARNGAIWYRQEPLNDVTFTGSIEAAADRNGTVYLISDSISQGYTAMPGYYYTRMVEPNLGGQDGMAAFGMGPNTSANVATGNLMTTLPVFSSRGVGFATGFALTYNSLDPDSGVISQGWQYNYQMTLTDHDPSATEPAGTKMSIKFSDGHSVVFSYNVTYGAWIADTEYGFSARIERLGAEYVLITKFGIEYTFNSSGKLREIGDTNGNTLTLAYTNGLLTSIVDSANRTTTLGYSADKQLQTITDPNTKTYTVTYNTAKKMTKLAFDAVTNVDWELNYYTADNFGYGERINLLKTVKTPRNNETLFNYQPDNRIWKSTDPSVTYLDDAGTEQTGSLAREIAYDDANRKATFKNRRLKNTVVDFLQRYALVTKATDHLGKFVLRSFDTANLNRNLLSFTDKRGNATAYTYAAGTPGWVNDNLASITRPGVATPIAYTYTTDGLNRVDTITDSKGALTDYNYDLAGNLKEILSSAAPISQNGEPEQTLTSRESFNYDTRGRMTDSTNADSVVTRFETADPATGLFTRTYVEGLQPDIYEFDVMGNVTRYTDPSGSVTKTVPDDLYRPDTVTSAFGTPEATTIDYGYDLDSNTETVADPKKTMTYVYNAVGRQTQVTNDQKTAPNNTIKYFYDQEGNTRKVEDYAHNITETRYNDLGQVEREILPGPPQIVTIYTYDDNGNVATVARNGKTTTYTYDVRNNQETVTLPPAADQIVETSYYDDNDNHKGTIRRKGATFVYGSKSAHDSRNRVQESQQLSLDPGSAYMKGDAINGANGPVTAYAYKHGGDRTSVTDPVGNTTVTLNDSFGRPEKVKDATGIIASKTTYDNAGRVYERYIQNPAVPNPTGDGSANLIMASRSIYNALGQIKEQYDAQLNKTEYFYTDANRNLTMIVDAEGHVTEMHYNNLDQMDWKKEFLSYPSSSVLTQFTYDDNGNMASVIDPRGKTYGYTYDQSGRLVAIAYPILGHTESWVYNEDGNLFTHTDANGKVVTYTYDDLGRVISEQHGAPYNVTIARTYDDASNLATISDGNMVKSHAYNTLQRLTGVNWTVGGAGWKSIAYSYNDAGLRTGMTDPEGNVFSYAYTPNSQLSQITRNLQLVTSLSYDSGGRKISSSLANGTSLRYTYDIKERLANVRAVRSTGSVVSSFTYGYNKIDNRTSMTIDHENTLVNYGYDGLSRLTSESWNLGAGTSCANQFTSQPAGNESGFSNTVAATPAAGVLTSPYLASYAYDVAGNRTARYRLDGGSTYVVDDENRLTTESPFTVQALTPVTTTTQDNWVELDFGAPVSVFRLDVALPDLNRRFKLQAWDGAAYQDIVSLAVLGATLDADGFFTPFSQSPKTLCSLLVAPRFRYWQESGSSSGVSLVAYTMVAGTPIAYTYDANGNQLTRGQETLSYDYANRVVSWTDQQAAYSYIFAPSGERMAKVNPDGSSEWYMYDGDDIVADYAKPSGDAYTLSATYANGLGIDSKIARYDVAGAPSYYIPDALGSVHRILDGSQNITNTYLTNAWGESLISQEGIPNRYGFTQRERDPESSLMHYRARSYDPRLGRFIQRDPSGMVDGPNMYTYVRNNPITSTDPLGLIEFGGKQMPEEESHRKRGGPITRYTDSGKRDWAVYLDKENRYMVAPITSRYENPITHKMVYVYENDRSFEAPQSLADHLFASYKIEVPRAVREVIEAISEYGLLVDVGKVQKELAEGKAMGVIVAGVVTAATLEYFGGKVGKVANWLTKGGKFTNKFRNFMRQNYSHIMDKHSPDVDLLVRMKQDGLNVVSKFDSEEKLGYALKEALERGENTANGEIRFTMNEIMGGGLKKVDEKIVNVAGTNKVKAIFENGNLKTLMPDIE